MSLMPVTPDLGDKKFWFKKDSIAVWVIVGLEIVQWGAN